MTYRFLLMVFLGAIATVASAQKKTNLLATRPVAFSAQGIADIQKGLDMFNQSSAVQVVFRATMVPLSAQPSYKMPTDKDLANKSDDEIGEIIARFSNAMDDFPDFPKACAASDAAAKNVLKGLPNNKNILLVNICVGVRVIGLKKKNATKAEERKMTHKAYSQITPLAGSDVPADFVNRFKKYCDNMNIVLDFYDKTLDVNDGYLNNILKFFFQDQSALVMKYDVPSSVTFDDNMESKCSMFPSYQTKPVAGRPWKLVPADGTPVAIAVEAAGAPGTLEFKLDNTADFTLQSSKPDGKSMIYISSTKRNATTAVIPVLDGTPILGQSLQVVAYAKRRLKVAVVYIEEENDDVQVVPQGQGKLAPGTVVVSAGPNGFLDSAPGGDDKVIKNSAKIESITCGANGICESEALHLNVKFNTYLDRGELEAQLNKFYNPFMVEWSVDKTEYSKPINYDLNRNGYLEIGGYPDPMGPFVPHPEELTIFANARIGPGDIDHYLFVIPRYDNDDPGDYLYGRTTGDLKSALVFASEMRRNIDEANNSGSIKDYLFTTSAHELGHCAFGYADFKLSDPTNLMQKGHPMLNQCRLRKFQWDLMHR